MKKESQMRNHTSGVFLGVVLLAALAAAPLLAEGSREDSAGAGSEAAAPYEISWYFTGNGAQRDEAAVEAALNEYLVDRINATIDINALDWGSFDSTIQLMIASGEPFDLCFTSSWTNNYVQNVSRGAFLPLDDLLQENAPKLMEQMPPLALEAVRIDGNVYAVPAIKEQAHNFGFYVRTDMLEKYNLDPSTVETFEDIEPFFETIAQNEPEMLPYDVTGGTGGYVFLDWDWMGEDTIGVLDQETLQVVNEWALPETRARLETMERFYNAGYLRRDVATIVEHWSFMKRGEAFATSQLLKPGEGAVRTREWGYPVTQIDVTEPVMSTRDILAAMMAVSITSGDPARSIQFLDLLATDPFVNNTVNYGVEGTHFVKVGENTIDFPAGLNSQTNGYFPGTTWMFGSMYPNYIFPGDDPDIMDTFRRYNDNARPHASLGFLFDSTPVKAAISAVANVMSEYATALSTGSVPVASTLPEFLEKLEQVGVGRILEEKQRQFDAWYASR